MVMVLVTGLS